jgi:hypothetical protein
MEQRKEDIKESDFSPLSPNTTLSPLALFCMRPLPTFGVFSQIINSEMQKNQTPISSDLPCGCQKTKCLKLYCECFAEGKYCLNCNCKNCHNTADHEEERKDAIDSTKDKHPGAFRKDISNNYKVCHCKKSFCLKKYCECYQANRPCSSNCKCRACKNKTAK